MLWELLMIKALSGLPKGVIGFEMEGKLDAADYRDVLIPAIEQAAASGPLRVVLIATKFSGLSGGAMWQDLKLATHHLTALKRFAFITDIEWMANLTAVFGWMVPGEIRVFEPSERDAAIEWVTADSKP
jgi:hypothetical protein